jgi:restriction endonuclease S subunit
MTLALPRHIERFRTLRIEIPSDMECESFSMSNAFDFLEKNNGLTEEFIYNNTNPESAQYPIYTASYEPIGYLPVNTIKDGEQLKVCGEGTIIIFRQGYAGLMYIPSEVPFFASEHTIPVRPKKAFRDKLNPQWFVKYYEPEVLHYVTGKADSRNFSELAFKKIPLLLPKKSWQDECAKLYQTMDTKLLELEDAIREIPLIKREKNKRRIHLVESPSKHL